METVRVSNSNPIPPTQEEIDWINSHWIIDPIQGTITSSNRGIIGHKIVDGHIRVSALSKEFQVHNLVWWKATGFWPAIQIDHVSRIKEDNRFSNLREVTHSVQMHNRKIKSGNFGSGVRIARDSVHLQAYEALISHQGKKMFLKRSTNPEELAILYQRAKDLLLTGAAFNTAKELREALNRQGV